MNWRIALIAILWGSCYARPPVVQQPIRVSTVGARPRPSVTTYHYDNWRSGWNPNETILNPTLRLPDLRHPERAETFGLLQTVPVDGTVYAQPLLIPDLTISGGVNPGKHDVVYVATESNTVYAIDANNGDLLLTRNLGPPVVAGSLPHQCDNNGPLIGIESTPVIDATNSVMYVVAYHQFEKPTYRVYALDLATLSDRVPAVTVSAKHVLTDGSQVTFDATYQRQRPALLLASGNVYAAFGSFCDQGPSRGWVLGWTASSLSPLPTSFLTNLVPGSSLSSVWMSGYGPAADPAGQIYFSTGNGASRCRCDSATNGSCHPDPFASKDVSDSVVKISADLGGVGFFAPHDVGLLDACDDDLSSGGVLLLPDQSGSPLHLATAAGKTGSLFLLNRDDLGRFNATDRVFGTFDIGSCFCGESFYADHVVTSGGAGLAVYNVQTSATPTLSPAYGPMDITLGTAACFPAGSMEDGFFTSVSSNGSQNVIIWAVSRPSDDAARSVALSAIQPVDGSNQLNCLGRWTAGGWALPWGEEHRANIVPVVANGHVYVASYGWLYIFGFGPKQVVTLGPSPALPRLPPLPKITTGVIVSVNGSRFTMKISSGSEVVVNAEPAIKRDLSSPLVVGSSVSVHGELDSKGVLNAEVINRGPAPKRPKGTGGGGGP